MVQKGMFGEVQPGRWDITPNFDKEGRPVEFPRSRQDGAQPKPQPASSEDRNARRDALEKSIRDLGLKRPAARASTGGLGKRRRS